MKAEKTATICISSLLILLIVLQFNSVGFTPAFAQLGGPDGENLNLDGIWEVIDEYPEKDIVYINQEGTQIRATFEPTGYCYEDPSNPIEGTEYAPGKLDFRGNLIGNTIEGVMVVCLPDERTTTLVDLNLRVSSDGRTLDGYYMSPDGQQNTPIQYVFDSDLPPVSIEINTDRPVYDLNEPVEISGQVTNRLNQESDVLIEVNGPDGQQVFSEPVLTNPDGSFSTSFDLNGDQFNNGRYTAMASHAGAINNITFEVGANQPPLAAIATTGAIIAAGGTGGILLYKKGYFKGIKHGAKNIHEEEFEDQETETDELSIIELRIECGLENSEVIKRESSKGGNTITGELAEVEQKFSQAINNILENRKKIKSVQKDIDFIKWCKEAGENPNKILSKISEEVIGKFLTSVQPYFQNLLLSEISVESDISVTEDNPKRVRKSVIFNLNPIQAYIALVVYNNGVPVSSTKFIFAINSYVKIKNLTVYLGKVSGRQALLKQSDQQVQHGDEEIGSDDESVDGRKIKVENLLFGISIDFTKIKIAGIEKSIEPPLGLGKKEVEVKNILLFSQ